MSAVQSVVTYCIFAARHLLRGFIHSCIDLLTMIVHFHHLLSLAKWPGFKVILPTLECAIRRDTTIRKMERSAVFGTGKCNTQRH